MIHHMTGYASFLFILWQKAEKAEFFCQGNWGYVWSLSKTATKQMKCLKMVAKWMIQDLMVNWWCWVLPGFILSRPNPVSSLQGSVVSKACIYSIIVGNFIAICRRLQPIWKPSTHVLRPPQLGALGRWHATIYTFRPLKMVVWQRFWKSNQWF